ncbi:hypothetical protein [Avibacterium sp. 21-599]|uniref:hypothetical protein n=1 Tax=Avibacterium sp. 21-599 TaxID=2911528 RepID=UPI002245AF45|nr:hypothetical protein [Avibacterium sp. 21-599]MCW9716945.1 hypothetical protein [Avibacterium sp. 21-599]
MTVRNIRSENTGYQLIHENNYDVNSLIKSELSTVLTRGRTLGQQLSTNIILNTVTTEKPEDYGKNALGAVTGTLSSKFIGQIGGKYNNLIYTSIYSNYASEYFGEYKNIKSTLTKQRNILMKEKNKFYLDCLIFAILSYVLFLVYDLLITIYVYIKYDFLYKLLF